MKLTILFFLTILLLSGCKTNIPDKKTPEGAFIRLSRCIDSASTKCLFWELDNETRWSVSTVHKILRQIRAQVSKSYPKDQTLRDSVFGKWRAASKTANAEQMFQTLCDETHCLKKLAQGFGAIQSIKKSNSEATITTVRGAVFTMRKIKGTWGIVLLAEALDGEQIRLSDTLKQVKRNAAEYEQQRLATGQ